MRYILILILSLNLSYIFAHDIEHSPVHQRIVVEAYKLLKLQFSKQENGFADMDQYIGSATHYGNNDWFNVGSIAEGAENEDHKDIIWDTKWSRTHFWDADSPWGLMHLHEFGYFNSAFTKAKRFMYDEFDKVFKFPHKGGETAGYQKLWVAPTPNEYLADWYWKESMFVNYAHDVGYYSLWIPHKKKKNYYEYVDGRKIFFNILGRVCHLLTDMGVPEHAKRSIHPNKKGIFGWNSTPFEHWLSDEYDTEFYWTAERVYHERGGFINPFCHISDKWKDGFLFYTLAQLSDWFISCGELSRNGNDNYRSDVGEIYSILQSYAPPDEGPFDEYIYHDYFHLTLGGSVQRWDLSNEEGRAFRDVLLPYTIRAVAGMMYKYIIETKMQYPNNDDGRGFIFKQQPELNLFNQDIDGNHYSFRAESTPGRITVCPENRPAGYPADFTIGQNARNVTFQASNEIVFKPGFSSKAGSEVRAFICEGCNKLNFNNMEGCSECPDYDFNPQYDKSSN